jgi:hypothetical protein
MNVRPKLSYANVAATIALVLALGGGTVYAASHLGKNSVDSKAIKKGAVKNSDLAKNAVTGKKVKNGSLTAEDLVDGVIRADVTGTANGGPQAGINTNTSNALPLTGDTTFTPGDGEVAAIAAEGRFTIASTSGAVFCSPAVRLLLNGQPTRVFVSPDADGNNTTPITSPGRDADGPFGMIDAGQPLTITAQLQGDVDCTPASQLDKLVVRIVEFK